MLARWTFNQTFSHKEGRGSRLGLCSQLETSAHAQHSVDSRFGLYHVAVVLRFLRSPISPAEI